MHARRQNTPLLRISVTYLPGKNKHENDERVSRAYDRYCPAAYAFWMQNKNIKIANEPFSAARTTANVTSRVRSSEYNNILFSKKKKKVLLSFRRVGFVCFCRFSIKYELIDSAFFISLLSMTLCSWKNSFFLFENQTDSIADNKIVVKI